jgi:hypothetical protein
MAQRKAYPAFPAHSYWSRRQKFIQSYPGRVTRDYLKSALGVGDKVAMNIHPPLKQLGLIDEDNKPTDLAQKWRDDARYGDATREIIEAVYPQDLRDVSPPDNPDIAAATRWFLNDTQSGVARARQLATFYVMLAKGDATDTSGARPRRAASPRATGLQRREDADTRTVRSEKPSKPPASQDGKNMTPPVPSLNLAVQVYIDKDMSPEQVDHVFASMAKHLYGKE